MSIKIGTFGNDVIQTGDGDDVIISRGGEDIIVSGDGDDIIVSGSGDDYIEAGDGDDLVIAGSGDDIVYGGQGYDLIIAGSGNDYVDGGADNDLIIGNSGNDILLGGAGSDILLAGRGNDLALYNVNNNQGFWDYYDGGSSYDILELTVTADYLVNTLNLSRSGQELEDLFNNSGKTVKFSELGINLVARNFEEIQINVINTDPVANDDSADVSEDGPAVNITLTANDTDVDGDDVEIASIDTTGTLGSVLMTADNDSVTYDPNAQFEALDDGEMAFDSFSYTVDDGFGGSDSATVTVMILGANDAPTVDAIANANGLEDQVFSISNDDLLTLINADDVDTNDKNNLVAVIATASVVNGTLVQAGDDFEPWVFQPDADYNGDLTFSYQVSDGDELSAVGSATITIAAVNDAPSFMIGDDQVVAVASGAQSVSMWASDISAGPANESAQNLAFLINTDNDAAFAALPTINAETGDLNYELASDFVGGVNIDVSLQDDGGLANGGVDTSDVQSFMITAEGGLTIQGTDGDNEINGTAGDDTIFPALGTDVVNAGAGDDGIVFTDPAQYADADIIDGGAGKDEVVFDPTAAQYSVLTILTSVVPFAVPGYQIGEYFIQNEDSGVVDYANFDSTLIDINTKLIDIELVTYALKSADTDAIAIEYITATDEADVISTTAGAISVINARGGDDELTVSSPFSVLNPGPGSDTIFTNPGGIDWVVLQEGYGDNIVNNFDLGLDALFVNIPNLDLIGNGPEVANPFFSVGDDGSGNLKLTLTADGSSVTLLGVDPLDVASLTVIEYPTVFTEGNDTIVFDTDLTNELIRTWQFSFDNMTNAGGGDDDVTLSTILTGEGVLFSGGAGNDILRSQDTNENDRVAGDDGADTFVFSNLSNGQDTVIDYSSLESDKIDLQAFELDLLPDPQAALFAAISDNLDGNAVIDLEQLGGSAGDQVTLEGVQTADLSATDFIL